MPSTWFPKEPPKLIFKTQDKIGENIVLYLYLEAYNNQKQSEISNRKSLFISVF